MPTFKRKGIKGKYVEIPDELDRRFQAFCDGRGEKYTTHILMAMERHMAYPPPPPAPPPVAPLPDAAPAPAARPAKPARPRRPKPG